MSKPAPVYRYRAEVLRVIDGDTIRVRIDLGFYCAHELTVRLARIDAPEKNTEKGQEAFHWLLDTLEGGVGVVIETKKDRADKYGRYLGEVYDSDPAKSVNTRMLELGLAQAWPAPVNPPKTP